MRILGEPDQEFEPRNALKERVCSELKSRTGKDIRILWTREEYLRFHSDSHDKPIDSGFDFVVKTSTKRGDHYFSGLTHGVNIVDDDLVIEDIGGWRV